MAEWFLQLEELLQSNHSVVLVTVISVKGSAPRETGAKMLISENQISNTIGGGKLEYQAIKIARNMLSEDARTSTRQSAHQQRFSLGAGLGQCCGGVVTLFFEVLSQADSWIQAVKKIISQQEDFIQLIPLSHTTEAARMIVTAESVFPAHNENNTLISAARNMLTHHHNTKLATIDNIEYIFDPVKAMDFNVYIFGAGHVGEALINQLAFQPCLVNWVDSRDDQLPEKTPSNVLTINTDVPEAVIDEAPAGSYFLVMTHDHSLDQKLSEQILRRDDFQYFGLIGSLSKRKKFEHRLLERDITVKQLQKMICPIGISGINSKRPAAIALAVAAELIQIYEQSLSNKNNTVQQTVIESF